MVLTDDNFATIVAAVEKAERSRQHPQVPPLPAVVEHRRGDDDVLRCAARGTIGLEGTVSNGRAATGDADSLDQSCDR